MPHMGWSPVQAAGGHPAVRAASRTSGSTSSTPTPSGAGCWRRRHDSPIAAPAGHLGRPRRPVRRRGRERPALGDPVPPGEVRRRRCDAAGELGPVAVSRDRLRVTTGDRSARDGPKAAAEADRRATTRTRRRPTRRSTPNRTTTRTSDAATGTASTIGAGVGTLVVAACSAPRGRSGSLLVASVVLLAVGYLAGRRADRRAHGQPAAGPAAGGRRRRRPGGAPGAGRGRQRDALRRPARRGAGLAGRRARSGSTWSTSTRRSAAGPTASSWPTSSAGSTSTSSCPAASGTTRRSSRGAGHRAAGGSTSARPRWRTRTGPPSVIARHGDAVAVGLDVRGTTLAARGWTSEGGDLWETLDRLDARRLRALRRHRRHQGRHPARAEPRSAATGLRPDAGARRGLGRHRQPGRPGGAARPRRRRRRGRHRRQGALRRRVHPPAGARRRRPALSGRATGGATPRRRCDGLRRHAVAGPRAAAGAVRRGRRATGRPAGRGAGPARRRRRSRGRGRRSWPRWPGPACSSRSSRCRGGRREHGPDDADRGRRPPGPAGLHQPATPGRLAAGRPPVPVPGPRAALSAVAEGCDLLDLDPAGPVRYVVRRPAVWALGRGLPWTPSYADPVVAQEVSAICAAEGVVGRAASGATGAELRVVARRCRPGSPARTLEA